MSKGTSLLLNQSYNLLEEQYNLEVVISLVGSTNHLVSIGCAVVALAS